VFVAISPLQPADKAGIYQSEVPHGTPL